MTAADQPTAEPSEAAVRAAARTLNLNGWTCDGGSDEPGNYDECEDCQRCCDALARAALRSAAELGKWGRRITSAPAPQPAAATETEVQWGVRERPLVHGVTLLSTEDDARGLARRDHGVVVTRTFTTTTTPWKEA